MMAVARLLIVPRSEAPSRCTHLAIAECAASPIGELNTLAKTLTRWRTQIVNRHRTDDSNGPTEAVNNVKRAACGYRNFAHYRLRLLAHFGLPWETHRVATLRGCAPQFTA